MRRRATVLAILALSACAGADQGTVSLRLRTAACRDGATASPCAEGNVADASVTIDDQYVGPLSYVAAHGVALPRGKHRITVQKTGYFPLDRLVDATGEPIYLDVALVAIPD